MKGKQLERWILRDSGVDIIFLPPRLRDRLIFRDFVASYSAPTIAVISIYWIPCPALALARAFPFTEEKQRRSRFFSPYVYRVSNDAYRMEWKAGWIHYRSFFAAGIVEFKQRATNGQRGRSSRSEKGGSVEGGEGWKRRRWNRWRRSWVEAVRGSSAGW